MPTPTRVVVVGCGGMANAWVKLTAQHELLELVGLVDIRRAAAEAMADRHELPRSLVYDTLAEAVKATGAQAVFDVTIPAAHHDVTVEALGLGCHVLGEKPMSDSLDKARAMVAAAKKAGKLYGVTQTRRPAAFARRTTQWIKDGVIGDVQECHCDFYIGARFGAPNWTDFRNKMAHPLVLDMAIHTFDQARQMTRSDPVSVYCRTWNPRKSWYQGDASATAIFDMVGPDGRPLVLTYRGSWTMEGMQTDWNADWRIGGEKGTLHTNGNDVVEAEVVSAEAKPGDFFRKLDKLNAPPAVKSLGGHDYMIDNFARALADGTPLECPCEDNIKSLAMVLAAVKSADSGQKVAVEW